TPILIMAWRYGAQPPCSAPFEILGPPGTATLLERLADAFGPWMREPGFPLTVREMPFGERTELPGEAHVGTYKVPHTEESIAYSVERGGTRLVYTGDTGFDSGLAEWSAGCNVMICECSLPRAMAVAGHMTPEECGALGALARPGLLALTHFYPPVELEDIAGIVGSYYKGPLALATDGWCTHIEDSACS
ncbi:MAG: MBL fold metallo-hydrolase, partial [Gemmatimonadaceae bacterium]